RDPLVTGVQTCALPISAINPKQVASLEALNQERRALVKSVIPSVVAVKTSKKIGIRRQYGLDPFEFFFGNPRGKFRSPREEALEIGRASWREGGKRTGV